jgi:hypothetical protein
MIDMGVVKLPVRHAGKACYWILSPYAGCTAEGPRYCWPRGLSVLERSKDSDHRVNLP